MPGNKIKIESAVSLNIPMKFRKVNDKKIYDVLFIEVITNNLFFIFFFFNQFMTSKW